MYKTKKYGTVSCKTENQILAELERDLSKEKRKSMGLLDTIKAKSQAADSMRS